MRVQIPLSAKILLWFGLNLVVLALVFVVVFRAQFQFGLNSLLVGLAGDRIQAVAGLLVSELGRTPRGDWTELLQRFSEAHQVEFLLVRNDGRVLAGGPLDLPAPVRDQLLERRGPLFGGGRGLGPPGTRAGEDGVLSPGPRHASPMRPPVPGGLARGGFPKQILRTDDPRRYWLLVHVALADLEGVRAVPATVIMTSGSLRFGGLLLDVTPWLAAAFGGLLLSVLVWLPLVRGITRSISQMTRATGQIAEGRFEVRVPDQRGDELGVLAGAINRLALRLGGFVTGQKRFLGDIAHELCSPLARIQMALGILEQRAQPSQKDHLADLQAEVREMSALVNELMAFSKAGLRGQAVQLQAVNLAAIARRAIAREAPSPQAVELGIGPDLEVEGDAELLTRALANLLRNAVRYAGEAGPITVSAQRQGNWISVQVADSGPGVPADTLDRLFTPFFRPDLARSRETGGAGLGLAIVKTCVEACGGTVSCRNLTPKGFAVEMVFRTATPPKPGDHQTDARGAGEEEAGQRKPDAP